MTNPRQFCLQNTPRARVRPALQCQPPRAFNDQQCRSFQGRQGFPDPRSAPFQAVLHPERSRKSARQVIRFAYVEVTLLHLSKDSASQRCLRNLPLCYSSVRLHRYRHAGLVLLPHTSPWAPAQAVTSTWGTGPLNSLHLLGLNMSFLPGHLF